MNTITDKTAFSVLVPVSAPKIWRKKGLELTCGFVSGFGSCEKASIPGFGNTRRPGFLPVAIASFALRVNLESIL